MIYYIASCTYYITGVLYTILIHHDTSRLFYAYIRQLGGHHPIGTVHISVCYEGQSSVLCMFSN